MSATAYFRGKRVLVTGGSSGIGLALAKHLVLAGAEVILVARREGPLAEAKQALLGDAPSARVSTSACDVADGPSVMRTLGPIAEAGLDALVCSAGIATPGRFVDLPEDEFRRHMDVNYFGIVHACRAVLPHFVARRAGHVINVGSLGGIIGIYGYSAYAPTKFAVAGLSQALRAELRPYGVRVTVAHPPDTDTPMLERELPLRPAETRAIAGTVKPRTADEVARAILEGAAAGDFDVWCDASSRAMSVAHAVVPSLVRWFCDSAQDKASAQ